MCGIAGIVGSNQPGSATSMTESMRHRGPDDSGIFSEPGIVMGMTRLAVLDTSDAGHQPMSSHSGRYVMVYNGEVYNFREIRSDLEKNGEKFVSDSDTEVVLEAYSAWGKKCLSRFNGMFAFAIWDRHKHELFVARDHVGIKPFYFSIVKNAFYFASEIKTLLKGRSTRILPAFFDILHLAIFNNLPQS